MRIHCTPPALFGAIRTAALGLSVVTLLGVGCGTRSDEASSGGGGTGGASGGGTGAAGGGGKDASASDVTAGKDGAGGMTDVSSGGSAGGGAAGTAGAGGATGGSGGTTGGAGGVTAGAAGSTGGAAGAVGGAAGSTGGAAGAVGGAAGSTGGAAGAMGGAGGTTDGGDPMDVSPPQDVAPEGGGLIDGRYPDGCMPIACSSPIATYCGVIGDGCGGALDCGITCPGMQVCGARRPNICGAACPLCPQIARCESGTTTVSGTAVTGAATNPDPLYRALVFVPNLGPGGKLPPFVDGPSCNRCTPLTTDEAITSAVTAPNGSFVLQNVPAGSAIPLVVQLGRWRYETTIDVKPCENNVLPAGTARLPRVQTEGNIPLTAISTGNVDALECVLRKMGVADGEFSNPTGSGRIHFYRNNGANYDATTPNQAALVGAQATWDKYDQILFPCEGLQSTETPEALTSFINYTSKGGRVFTSHFSYTWLFQNGGFATAGTWQVQQVNPANPLVCNVDTSTPKGQDFATWLGLVGALSNPTPPQVSINDPRRNLNDVPAGQGGVRWLYSDNPIVVQHMTVETPVRAQPNEVCGRVIYSDFHVANAANSGLTFPAECITTDLTPQEKILEFMLLDLASCVGLDPPPDPPPPPPPPGD